MFGQYRDAFANLALVLVFSASFLLVSQKTTDYYPSAHYRPAPKATEKAEVKKKGVAKPEIIRGLYLTAYSAGNTAYRQDLLAKMKNSRINSVVIDIKDYSGYILYNSSLPQVQEIKASKNRIPEIEKIIQEFHDLGIYVIARQTVFQDPVLAKSRPDLAFLNKNGGIWYDHKGLAWTDPAKQEVWEYNLAIAKEAVALGFDEINFDYMRYPSDGNMANLNYNLPAGISKSQMLNEFFSYLSDNLSDKTIISIDTFGLVLDNAKNGYDLNIGQVLTELSDHFDYVCPMMYPSHYPLNYLGFANSAEHPGPVIAHGLKISKEAMENKRAKLRPWLQAFNLGAVYDSVKIEAQIKAVEDDPDTDGWLLWNARNYYPNYIF